MPSMIEDLIQAGIRRPDNKRLLPSRRPLPASPRDLFELFVALGRQATFSSLMQTCDLRQAEPRAMTYIALSRWPTPDELDALPTPYSPQTHLRAMLKSTEFRTSLVRRLCDAYPERQRLLFVIIPRCAGTHFLAMAAATHPILPASLAGRQGGDRAEFAPALGTYLARFPLTRTIMLARNRLATFVQATQGALPVSHELAWNLNPPPRRPQDRLFTIVRDPWGLLISQANATLTAWRAIPDGTVVTSPNLGQVSRPRLDDTAGWQLLGLKVLRSLTDKNPICQALGDGTAASALRACRHADIELVDLTLYPDWVKYTWDVEPEPPANQSDPFLRANELDLQTSRYLDTMVAEDLIFYDHIRKAIAALGELKTSVRGRDL